MLTQSKSVFVALMIFPLSKFLLHFGSTFLTSAHGKYIFNLRHLLQHPLLLHTHQLFPIPLGLNQTSHQLMQSASLYDHTKKHQCLRQVLYLFFIVWLQLGLIFYKLEQVFFLKGRTFFDCTFLAHLSHSILLASWLFGCFAEASGRFWSLGLRCLWNTQLLRVKFEIARTKLSNRHDALRMLY